MSADPTEVDGFVYGDTMKQAYERCPALRSVEPVELRIFLCGFIYASERRLETTINDLNLVYAENAKIRVRNGKPWPTRYEVAEALAMAGTVSMNAVLDSIIELIEGKT